MPLLKSAQLPAQHFSFAADDAPGESQYWAVFAATAADVTQVMVDGRVVVRQGDRDELGRELDEAIGRVWR